MGLADAAVAVAPKGLLVAAGVAAAAAAPCPKENPADWEAEPKENAGEAAEDVEAAAVVAGAPKVNGDALAAAPAGAAVEEAAPAPKENVAPDAAAAAAGLAAVAPKGLLAASPLPSKPMPVLSRESLTSPSSTEICQQKGLKRKSRKIIN